jgi:hypothetical protein
MNTRRYGPGHAPNDGASRGHQSRRSRNCAPRAAPSHRWDPRYSGLLEALSDVDGLISSYLPAGLGIPILAPVSVHDQVNPRPREPRAGDRPSRLVARRRSAPRSDVELHSQVRGIALEDDELGDLSLVGAVDPQRVIVRSNSFLWPSFSVHQSGAGCRPACGLPRGRAAPGSS